MDAHEKLKNTPTSKFSARALPTTKQSSNRMVPVSKASSTSITSAGDAFKQKFMMGGLKGMGGLTAGQVHGRFF
jgi:hypothetical protein